LKHLLRAFLRATIICSFFLSSQSLTFGAHIETQEEKLNRGDVVVSLEEKDAQKFVQGRIMIDQPPENVWPIMINPFEYQRSICPRMRDVKVLQDTSDYSLLEQTYEICFLIPKITYQVESNYTPYSKVQFKRTAGSLKEFTGSWTIIPRDSGTRSEVIFDLFIDPGIPVPHWIIQAGVKSELPHTLRGLRERVMAISTKMREPEQRNIAAAARVTASTGKVNKT